LRVHLVDPAAYTPPYDHALAAALAAEGADVTLVTGPFAHGAVPEVAASAPYAVDERFYRWTPSRGGDRARRAARLAQHVPGMLRYRQAVAGPAGPDVVHWQWLPVQPVDARLLGARRSWGGPRVLTAHDVLPREPRPGQLAAQRALYERMDAVVVHSEHGRGRLVGELGIDPALVHVIPHGAFTHLPALADPRPLPADLAGVEGPVVLFFGLLRPYKGLDVLLEAWRGIDGAELWIAGAPRGVDVAALRAAAPAERPLRPALHRRPRDPRAVPPRRPRRPAVPRDRPVRRPVHRARLRQPDPRLRRRRLPRGRRPRRGRPRPARRPRRPSTPALEALLADPARREALGTAARRAAADVYAWPTIARQHLELYATLRRGLTPTLNGV
jgi:glycosyltransferase involved in cell wall biosynthesis